MILSFQKIKKQISDDALTVPGLVEKYLDRIEERSDLNAFISVRKREALLRRAAEIQSRLLAGQAGPLAGMIVAVKDVIATTEEPTTCGSGMLKDFVSPYDATAVERLEKSDALVIGKTNCDEFSMGSSGETSYFGPVANPHDKTRVAGGSSSGSAVAVAAGMCTVALGSDTGGSVRLPAAFCGVCGFKPTWGRVSRYGLVAHASSFDQIGILGCSAGDCRDVLSVIAGLDPMDATTSSRPVNFPRPGINGVRVGIPREYLSGNVNPEVVENVAVARKKLESAGAVFTDISLPHTEYAVAAYYLLASAEASANLARFDGVRYGYRTRESRSIEEMYSVSRTEALGSEVKRRILLGTFALRAGHRDDYHGRALRVRRLVARDFVHAFSSCDLILTPVSTAPAFPLGEKTDDPLEMYMADAFTVPASLAGIPALAVPFGVSKSGLPFGVQLMSGHFEEDRCLSAAERLVEYP